MNHFALIGGDHRPVFGFRLFGNAVVGSRLIVIRSLQMTDNHFYDRNRADYDESEQRAVFEVA